MEFCFNLLRGIQGDEISFFNWSRAQIGHSLELRAGDSGKGLIFTSVFNFILLGIGGDKKGVFELSDETAFDKCDGVFDALCCRAGVNVDKESPGENKALLCEESSSEELTREKNGSA